MILKNPKDLEEHTAKLERYAHAFKALGTNAVRVGDNISVPMSDEYRDRFQITGQVARLDLAAEGNRAWLFAKTSADWSEELRLPLIQFAYAAKLAVDLEEVVPGIYDFSTGRYTEYRFNAREIAGAKRRLGRLLESLAQLRSLG